MLALVASIIALFLGAFIYLAFGQLRRFERFVSGLVLVAIGGIVLIEILPELVANSGWLIILPLLLGFFGPLYIETQFEHYADSTHKFVIALGILGLLVHSFFDGAALSINGHDNQNFEHLALAVVAHRIPVGLTIWWLISSYVGVGGALITISLMSLATFTGYHTASTLISIEQSVWIALVQSFVAGSLLHVIYYRPHSDGCSHAAAEHIEHQAHHGTRFDKWTLFGMIMGLFVFFIITNIHVH